MARDYPGERGGRHPMSGVKRQVEGHRAPVALAGGALLAGLVAALVAAAWRRQHGARLGRRAAGLREAFSRMVAHPDRVARSRPGWMSRLAVGVLSSVAAAAARRLTERVVRAPGAGASTGAAGSRP